MRAEIARLDVRLRRRSTIGYSLGMAVYTLVVVALYPAFENTTSLDKLARDDPTISALFGINGPLSTSSGWLSGNIYANFLPLLMLLLTIGYGAASLAGQNEQGTLCLVATLRHVEAPSSCRRPARWSFRRSRFRPRWRCASCSGVSST